MTDKSLYEQSNGGITFSGGDPLLWSAQLIPLLQRLKEENIHIAYETTLYYKDTEQLRQVVNYVEQWIIDLKLQPVNFKGDYVNVLARNLINLRDMKRSMVFRLVFVEQVEVAPTVEILKRLKVEKLEVIKCHALAKTKYRKLGLPFEDYSPSDEAYQGFVQGLKESGIKIDTLTL